MDNKELTFDMEKDFKELWKLTLDIEGFYKSLDNIQKQMADEHEAVKYNQSIGKCSELDLLKYFSKVKCLHKLFELLERMLKQALRKKSLCNELLKEVDGYIEFTETANL